MTAHASVTAFVERVAAPVGLLGLVADQVRQRRFGDLALEVTFSSPAQSRKLERKPWTVEGRAPSRRITSATDVFDSA